MGKYYQIYTLVKGDHKEGYSTYVRGRVTGIALVMLDIFEVFGLKECADGWVFGCMCKPRKYRKFAKYIEKRYPGLCVFNYKEES